MSCQWPTHPVGPGYTWPLVSRSVVVYLLDAESWLNDANGKYVLGIFFQLTEVQYSIDTVSRPRVGNFVLWTAFGD